MVKKKLIKCAKEGCGVMVSPTQRYCYHHLRAKWSIKAPMIREDKRTMSEINTILYSKGFLGEVEGIK